MHTLRPRKKKGISWSDVELTSLLEDEDSHVYFELQRKHFGLHPFHLTNINVALNEILSSNLNFYDPELKGFLLMYKNPKLLNPLGEILYDTCYIHIDIEAEFYIFRPEVGQSLKGFVNKKTVNHIGLLVHKAFNVSIPRPDNDEEWPGDLVSIGQEIRFTITQLNFKSRLPYIRGSLSTNDYLSGCSIHFNSEMMDTDVNSIPNKKGNTNKESVIKEEVTEDDGKIKKKKKNKVLDVTNNNSKLENFDEICYEDRNPAIINGCYSDNDINSSVIKGEVIENPINIKSEKSLSPSIQVKHKKNKKKDIQPANDLNNSFTVLNSDSITSDSKSKRKKHKKESGETENYVKKPLSLHELKDVTSSDNEHTVHEHSLSKLSVSEQLDLSTVSVKKSFKKSKKHVKHDEQDHERKYENNNVNLENAEVAVKDKKHCIHTNNKGVPVDNDYNSLAENINEVSYVKKQDRKEKSISRTKRKLHHEVEEIYAENHTKQNGDMNLNTIKLEKDDSNRKRKKKTLVNIERNQENESTVEDRENSNIETMKVEESTITKKTAKKKKHLENLSVEGSDNPNIQVTNMEQDAIGRSTLHKKEKKQSQNTNAEESETLNIQTIKVEKHATDINVAIVPRKNRKRLGSRNTNENENISSQTVNEEASKVEQFNSPTKKKQRLESTNMENSDSLTGQIVKMEKGATDYVTPSKRKRKHLKSINMEDTDSIKLEHISLERDVTEQFTSPKKKKKHLENINIENNDSLNMQTIKMERNVSELCTSPERDRKYSESINMKSIENMKLKQVSVEDGVTEQEQSTSPRKRRKHLESRNVENKDSPNVQAIKMEKDVSEQFTSPKKHRKPSDTINMVETSEITKRHANPLKVERDRTPNVDNEINENNHLQDELSEFAINKRIKQEKNGNNENTFQAHKDHKRTAAENLFAQTDSPHLLNIKTENSDMEQKIEKKKKTNLTSKFDAVNTIMTEENVILDLDSIKKEEDTADEMVTEGKKRKNLSSTNCNETPIKKEKNRTVVSDKERSILNDSINHEEINKTLQSIKVEKDSENERSKKKKKQNTP